MDAEVPPIVTKETSNEVSVSIVASPPGDETKNQDKDTPIMSDADKNSEKPTSLNNDDVNAVESTDVCLENTDNNTTNNEKVTETTDSSRLSDDNNEKVEEEPAAPVVDSTQVIEPVTQEDSPGTSEKSTEVGIEEKKTTTTTTNIAEKESTVVEVSSSNDNESDKTEKTIEPEKSKDLESKDLEENKEANKDNKNTDNDKEVTKSSDSSVATIVLDAPEKKVDEPENTEFVQITQDKNDDSNTETQVTEAEDPFAGDSLATETLENMDNDDIGFSKLGEQADNLQDVVNSKSSDETPKEGEKTTTTTSEVTTSPVVETLDKETTEEITKKSQEKEVEVIEKNDSTKEKSKSPSKKEDKDKNDKDKNNSKQSEKVNEGQSDVLPGQDDELCIIPDRGIVIPKTTEATTTTTDDKNKEKDTADKPEEEISKDINPEEQQKEKKISGVSVISAAKSGIPSTSEKNTTTTEKADKPNDKEMVVDSVVETIDNVINIDGEKSDDMEIVTIETCKQCKQQKPCTIQVKLGSESANVCSRLCQANFLGLYRKTTDTSNDGTNLKYEKRCAFCLLIVETDDERNLSWETMEFCNEECLGKLQTKYGSYCKNCNGTVQPMSLGKYCVRFGYDVRQFCCSSCLEEFKKGLKVCSYCQKDISSNTDGFLAPVGDRGQFKDFCTHNCMDKYSKMNSTDKPNPEEKSCSVCQEKKIVYCEIQIDGGMLQAICSEPCFAAFKFVSKVDPDNCSTCKKYFKILNSKNTVVFYNNDAHTFCSKSCLNIFIISNRKIVPCNWCKVKKYNFDMIKKDLKSGGVVMMCSLNCLTLYQVSINAVSARKINCDLCKEFSQAQYHLTMSDATIRNFCSYNCVMKFQGQYTKSPITIPIGEDTSTPPVPTGMPKRTYPGKTMAQSSLAKKTITTTAVAAAVAAAGAESSMTTTTTPTTATTMTGGGNIQNLQSNKKTMPVISSVSSLATMSTNGLTNSTVSQKPINSTITTSIGTQAQIIYKQQLITRPTSPIQVHNKMTQCKPLMHTKGVSVRPHPCSKSTQTDEIQKILVPIPVPIYVPFPVHMFSFPVPVPLPFPIPIPVPIFIPTTRNSAKGIFKDLKRIREKIPSDPIEAELLMMAEKAEMESEKRITIDEPDSDSSCDDNNQEPEQIENSINEDYDDNNDSSKRNLDVSLEDLDNDVNQEHAEDLEATLATNTITAPPSSSSPPPSAQASSITATTEAATVTEEETTTTPVSSQESTETSTVEVNNAVVTTDDVNLTPDDKDEPTPPPLPPSPRQEQQPQQQQQQQRGTSTTRGKKRLVSSKPRSTSVKRNRKSNNKDNTKQGLMPPPIQTNQDGNNVLRTIDAIEKPDANMALKYLFGKNAWCQWVVNKNHELEKQNTLTRKVKLFKTDLLQLTADELNYSLCLFVKEVRKPNGTEYAPDTIYYLCLGIQQYLFENGRIDNIFTDTYYEKFTDCLDEIARKFSVLYNDAQYIVTRVEEEHLWECKQLGAHSPHVLLSTLMFFNTKHFNLVSADEHMQLSFSHIMKHWKRNQNAQAAAVAPKTPGSRNTLLRFYPPQSALAGNSKKKKVYEQQENEENPLRCPVKLYEFYLSKCPESVKTRNDVFYLLPERSCVPDSPVWYSTSPLAKENLVKMLNRVKIVKEINVSLLSS